MDYKAIEKKWQKKWDESGLYKFHENKAERKLYVLEMLPYPSGARLHIGHWYNYGPSDSYARFKRMQGFEVFQPMGFDAFGLPAENYAIKSGVHPQDSTIANIKTMEDQLKAIGPTYDWEYTLQTCSPDYYRWTQWCFLELYRKGLAYRKEAPVNYCPSCNTVLANEQVIDGECERCSAIVTRKNLTQWFFKITDYAEELLSDLDGLDWPEKTKQMQRNWIGKSVGGEILFRVKDSDLSFKVFTTRADTLFGCTYVVLSPESTIVEALTTEDNKEAVEAYKNYASQSSEIDRLSTVREKTGVFTGSYAINPINGREVPIWIADYVLASYGTGCVMAVPAHDERDYAFAEKFGLKIERVIKGIGNVEDSLPFVEYGEMVNSQDFNGLKTEEGKMAILQKLSENDSGLPKINYRLRDWLISRQRYWGAPIPIIHCESCGTVPVPEDQLPVLLPYDVDFRPDGTSPLLRHEGFMNAKCPKCGADAKRDADTMDTFVCSSWYFLRYPDNKNDKEAWNREWINKMLPVDKYIGGAEHACMHLLYARFFTKALRDLGHLDFSEPFLSLVHQGVILGPDGNRMSKSKGNVVSPDSYVEANGADVFRMYLMFGFNYFDGGAWSDDGIKAIRRFIERFERLVEKTVDMKKDGDLESLPTGADAELNYVRHSSIKSITFDMDRFQFNTAVARLMEYVNALYKYIDGDVNPSLLHDAVKDLLLLTAPFIPHIAEELWDNLGYDYSVHSQKWPMYDESALVKNIIELGVQINGKLRGKIELPSGTGDEEVKAAVLADDKISHLLDGKELRKIIIIKDRLINIVIS